MAKPVKQTNLLLLLWTSSDLRESNQGSPVFKEILIMSWNALDATTPRTSVYINVNVNGKFSGGVNSLVVVVGWVKSEDSRCSSGHPSQARSEHVPSQARSRAGHLLWESRQGITANNCQKKKPILRPSDGASRWTCEVSRECAGIASKPS